jgi:hypothetical protein
MCLLHVPSIMCLCWRRIHSRCVHSRVYTNLIVYTWLCSSAVVNMEPVLNQLRDHQQCSFRLNMCGANIVVILQFLLFIFTNLQSLRKLFKNSRKFLPSPPFLFLLICLLTFQLHQAVWAVKWSVLPGFGILLTEIF